MSLASDYSYDSNYDENENFREFLPCNPAQVDMRFVRKLQARLFHVQQEILREELFAALTGNPLLESRLGLELSETTPTGGSEISEKKSDSTLKLSKQYSRTLLKDIREWKDWKLKQPRTSFLHNTGEAVEEWRHLKDVRTMPFNKDTDEDKAVEIDAGSALPTGIARPLFSHLLHFSCE